MHGLITYTTAAKVVSVAAHTQAHISGSVAFGEQSDLRLKKTPKLSMGYMCAVGTCGSNSI